MVINSAKSTKIPNLWPSTFTTCIQNPVKASLISNRNSEIPPQIATYLLQNSDLLAKWHRCLATMLLYRKITSRQPAESSPLLQRGTSHMSCSHRCRLTQVAAATHLGLLKVLVVELSRCLCWKLSSMICLWCISCVLGQQLGWW